MATPVSYIPYPDGWFFPRWSYVAKTDRLDFDQNLGPHLHLFLQQESEDGTDAAWQERYFPPMEEIPLAVYLAAVCRYGWTKGGFGSYGFDWKHNDIREQHRCMAMLEQPLPGFTMGECAQYCHSAVASFHDPFIRCPYAALQKIPSSLGDPCVDAVVSNYASMYAPYTEYGEQNGACLRRCDDRFSDMLLGYWRTYTGTEWMEWTWSWWSYGTQGPVRSGYLSSSEEWVYEGGIGSNNGWNGDFWAAFNWAMGATSGYSDSASPARSWFSDQMGGTTEGLDLEGCKHKYTWKQTPG